MTNKLYWWLITRDWLPRAVYYHLTNVYTAQLNAEHAQGFRHFQWPKAYN